MDYHEVIDMLDSAQGYATSLSWAVFEVQESDALLWHNQHSSWTRSKQENRINAFYRVCLGPVLP